MKTVFKTNTSLNDTIDVLNNLIIYESQRLESGELSAKCRKETKEFIISCSEILENLYSRQENN